MKRFHAAGICDCCDAPVPDFEKCRNCGAAAEEFCSWDPARGWCCANCGGCDSDE